jgi:hypothetical protein
MDFGAVADGSTAYSPGAVAVANQIALANAIATGKCVFIPFNLNGYSFSGSTTVNSNDCIQGEGQVLVKSQSSTSFLNVVGFNYPIVQISGLHIDMTGAGASSQAILLNNAAATVYAVQLYDLYFTNCVGAITDSGSFAHPIVDLRMARIRTALTLGTQIQIRSSQGFIHFNQVQIDNSNNVGAVTWDSINLGVVAGVEMNATDVTGPTTGTYQSGVYGIRITGTSSSAAVWMNRVNVDTTTGNGILISATTYVWLNNLDINNNLGNSLVLSTVTKGEVANSFLGGAIGRTGAAASASGIDLTSSSNVHFVNVSTENNTGSGFHINNSTDNLFSNIRSQGNTVDGFVELGTSDRNLVSNAVFDTNGTSDIVLLGANSRAVHYETSGSYVGSLTPWTVTSGGTGRATLTIHAPLVGEGTSGINQVTAGTNGQLFLGSTGIDPLFATMSQDCTITNAGVVTCLKTNNVSFGTAAVANTGTSGATIPLLNGNLTWSGTNAFNGGFSTGSSTPPNLITTGIAGGAPQTSGTTDANQFLTAGNGTVQWRFGFYANGTMWSQPSLQSNYATNVGTVFNPNGGNVGIGNTGSVPNSLLSVAGRTEAFNYISVGTVPIGTTGSCVASSFVGGATAGKFAAAVCAGGTIILSSLPAAPTGYTCNAQDQTTPADTLKQTANTTTSVTFTATTVAADVVVFSCVGW